MQLVQGAERGPWALVLTRYPVVQGGELALGLRCGPWSERTKEGKRLTTAFSPAQPTLPALHNLTPPPGKSPDLYCP